MRSKDISCDELQNPEPQKGETEETDGEPPKKKNPPSGCPFQLLKKNSRIVKTAVLVGILVIVGGLLLGYMIKHREPTYQQIGTRYIDDPDWGNVYEISYVVKGEVTAERLNEHLREVRETVDREELGTNVVKTVYYRNKEDALAWKDTDMGGYTFLNVE